MLRGAWGCRASRSKAVLSGDSWVAASASSIADKALRLNRLGGLPGACRSARATCTSTRIERNSNPRWRKRSRTRGATCLSFAAIAPLSAMTITVPARTELTRLNFDSSVGTASENICCKCATRCDSAAKPFSSGVAPNISANLRAGTGSRVDDERHSGFGSAADCPGHHSRSQAMLQPGHQHGRVLRSIW